MPKTKKSFSKTQLVIIAAFALFFGGTGTYFLTKSQAVTNSPDFAIMSGSANAKLNNSSLTTITDSVYYLGNQTVIVLSPGQKANFSPQKGGGSSSTPTRNCYIMKAVNTEVSATITAGSAKVTKTIPVSLNAYQNHCVTYVSGTYPGFDVKNNSGGKLRIYQARYHFTNSNPGEW